MALAAALGPCVLEAFVRHLESHPRVAVFVREGIWTPREDVVVSIVEKSKASGHDSPFRRFYLLAQRMQIAGALASRQATATMAGDARLSMILEEYEAYRRTIERLNPRKMRRVDTAQVMAMGLGEEIVNGMRLYAALPRLFASYDTPITREAIRAAMAGNSFMRERARQSAALVIIMNRLMAGCSTSCYSAHPDVVKGSPHGQLLPYFANRAKFGTDHTKLLGIDVRHLGLHEWSQRGQARLEPWLSYPISDAVDPTSGKLVRALRLPAVHGCPMTAGHVIPTFEDILAAAGDHTEFLDFAIESALSVRQGLLPGQMRKVTPFAARPAITSLSQSWILG